MTCTDEKRRTSRYSFEAHILCSYFNTPISANAKTINFSLDGMYFISEIEFYPGSTVIIHAINDSSHQKLPENT